MPQLDFSHFPAQIFWLLICFGALLLMMRFWIEPRIVSALDRRQTLRQNDLSEANRFTADAAAAEAAWQKALREAKDQAATRLDAARQQARKAETAKLEQAQIQISTREKEAHSTVQKALEEARREIPALSEQLAGSIVQAVTKRA